MLQALTYFCPLQLFTLLWLTLQQKLQDWDVSLLKLVTFLCIKSAPLLHLMIAVRRQAQICGKLETLEGMYKKRSNEGLLLYLPFHSTQWDVSS